MILFVLIFMAFVWLLYEISNATIIDDDYDNDEPYE
jgi:hypothetical protein